MISQETQSLHPWHVVAIYSRRKISRKKKNNTRSVQGGNSLTSPLKSSVVRSSKVYVFTAIAKFMSVCCKNVVRILKCGLKNVTRRSRRYLSRCDTNNMKPL